MINILIGILTGIISGIYSGLIVTRYARFAELRDEVLRIVRAIDYMSEANTITITNDEDKSKLELISSDLYFLLHQDAGEKVANLSSTINDINEKARAGKVGYAEYEECHRQWQEIARNLSPRFLTIITLCKTL